MSRHIVIDDKMFSKIVNEDVVLPDVTSITFSHLNNENASLDLGRLFPNVKEITVISDKDDAIMVQCWEYDNLETVNLESTVENLSTDYLADTKIKNVNLSMPNLVMIDEGVFSNSNIENISFPPSLQLIGANAFSYCYNLKSLKLPDNVKTLRHRAFFMCKNPYK